MTPASFKTSNGSLIRVIGDPELLTMDRIQILRDHFDSDPRIASISIQATDVSELNETFLRATAPAGCLIALTDNDLTRKPETGINEDLDSLVAWSQAASQKGLWHDWWYLSSRDVCTASVILEPNELDLLEAQDPTGSHFHAKDISPINVNAISITVDVTWLGEHETGAQVLTTAAIGALANDSRITSIRLAGRTELPEYARHLTALGKVHMESTETEGEEGSEPHQSDIVWYPNQIDQRVDIGQARRLGKRVITTYLDLIAYDIGMYHSSPESWAAYRAMQRKIALSVDGITTISKDVAKRLYQETPRLEHKRIHAIPLGLDHIAQDSPMEIPQGLSATRPFLLVFGNDFNHKNRDFAIEVWEELLNRGESIDLILAGLHVKASSSKDREKDLIAKHVNLRGSIHTLGHVSSSERAWLLKNAQAIIYPSSAEGFGFVPYEAALLGTPTSFTSFGPLKEISQVSGLPRNWSTSSYAADLHELIHSETARTKRVTQLQDVRATLTWQHFANQLVEFFARVSQMPTVSSSVISSASSADAAALSKVLNSKSWKVTAPLRKIMKK